MASSDSPSMELLVNDERHQQPIVGSENQVELIPSTAEDKTLKNNADDDGTTTVPAIDTATGDEKSPEKSDPKFGWSLRKLKKKIKMVMLNYLLGAFIVIKN